MFERAILQPGARVLVEVLQGAQDHVVEVRLVLVAVDGDLALGGADVVTADVERVGVDPEGGFAEGGASTEFANAFAVGGDIAGCYGVDVCGGVYDEDG